MADNANKPSEDKIDSQENDEIPPDTDIKNQYKEDEPEENQENEEVEENQIEENNENIEEDQENNAAEEEQNQIQQQNQVYEASPQFQEYQMSQQNQNYQIYQQNKAYQLNQQVESNQGYQTMEANPQLIYQYPQQGQENVMYNNYEMNNMSQQQQLYRGNPIVVDPIFVQLNENHQINQISQNGQQYQVNQGENLYQIISHNQENLFQRHFPNNQMVQNYNYFQNQNNQNSEFRHGLHEGKSKKNMDNISEKEISTKRNKEPKDSLSKVHVTSKKSENAKYSTFSRAYKGSSIIRKPPPLISFQNISSKKKFESKLKKNIEKKELLNFEEIPREEFEMHANKETLFLEGGIDTGRYKFEGKETLLKHDDSNMGKIKVAEDEVLKEINKRTKKKEKKVKMEVMHKFYALTEFERSIIKGKDIQKYEGGVNSVSNENNINSEKLSGQAEINLKSKVEKVEIKNEGEQIKESYGEENNGSSVISERKIVPMDNYSKYLYDQINRIRIDPQSFIGVIEDAKANIIKNKVGKYRGYVYNSKIKIALVDGEPAFDDAIEFLKNTEAMEILEFCPQITIPPPQSYSEIKDAGDLKEKVENLLDEGTYVKSYWRDVIKDPEIAFLMMIVDDNGSRSGMKRRDILNPKMKYIGISSAEIKGKFVCYITLSNKLTI